MVVASEDAEFESGRPERVGRFWAGFDVKWRQSDCCNKRVEDCMRQAERMLLGLATVGLLMAGGGLQAAGSYPRTIVANAKATTGGATITSTVTIHINRLVEPSRRDRLLKGMDQNGYQGLMDVMRPLPVIGTIATQRATVDVKYAWETPAQGKTRLIIVADKPLFFLPGDEPKARPGYQLTVVQLLLDDHGAGTGLIAGAARVKRAPEEGIILEDYATAPVDLTVSPSSSK
jgi:hypothetical protein